MVGQEIFEKMLGGGASETERSFLRVLLAHAPVVIVAVDRNGVVMLAEGRGVAALVRAPGEVVGQSIHSIYRDKPALLDNLLRALTGETFRTELHLPGSAWDVHYAPVRGAKEEIVGALVVATDLTDLLRAEERARHT